MTGILLHVNKLPNYTFSLVKDREISSLEARINKLRHTFPLVWYREQRRPVG
jgi:hypothetical protein